MKKFSLIMSIIFMLLTFIGAGYVLINHGQVNAGYAVVPEKESFMTTDCEAVNPDNKNQFKDYTQNSDGTWECDGVTYKYKLGISGTMPNASKDTFFVYLSNLENISFEQAWKAAGFSSNSDDYFDVKDAVLVEWRTEN